MGGVQVTCGREHIHPASRQKRPAPSPTFIQLGAKISCLDLIEGKCTLLLLTRTWARRKARGTAVTAVQGVAAGTHGFLPVLGAAPWGPRAAEAGSERRGDHLIASGPTAS